MPNLKLIIALIGVSGIIIVAMAIYLFLSFSSINLTNGVILIAAGVVVLFIIMGILFTTFKRVNSKK